MDGPRFELGASPLPAKRSDQAELTAHTKLYLSYLKNLVINKKKKRLSIYG